MVTIQSPAEERTVLYHISWDTYQSIVRDHEDSSAPRFSYDRGTLEIMSPLPIHERYSRMLDLFVSIVSEEIGEEAYGLGSTTFSREDLQRGFEPDSCFYLENIEKVRGKERLDLRVDPPPDLVIEIDITHSSLDKLGLYRQLGVREVWRYDRRRLEMLRLSDEGYARVTQSECIPAIQSRPLEALLRDAAGMDDTAWMRRVRAWVRQQLPPATA
jgi:Uma2 family endonuclease